MQHNLVLSGGGVHTLAFVGCIKYLRERNESDNIKNVLGSSGGSIIGLMFVLNFTVDTMTTIINDIFQMYNNQQKNAIGIQVLMNIYKKMGIYNRDFNDKIISRICKEKNLSEDLTFMELAKLTGKNLIISASNLSQKNIEYLSVDTYPEMSIKTAIAMSTAIPIIYEPIKYYNDIYVDGIVYDNFPITYFSKRKVDTLGLKVKCVNKNSSNSKLSLTQYLLMLFNSFTYKESLPDYNICEILIDEKIKNFDVYSMKFVVDEEITKELITIGYDHLSMFFAERK